MAPAKGKMSQNEEKLKEAVIKGDLATVKALIAEPDVSVDCLDSSGMTPLQQAAYRGDRDMCEFLLSHGADVNSNEHESGYTALMFGALSGKTAVTQLLLEAGAKTDVRNSLGRTATQMAAFVGQHQCVSLINNFFSKEDLDYYTRPRGLEKEPKLPPELAPALYKLILINNLHPVALSKYLQQNLAIVDDSYKVAKVLDLCCEKFMKSSNTNEVMAIKFNYLACLIRESAKCRKQKGDNLEFWIKSLARGREGDGFPVNQEMFIRSTFKEFPYLECQLLQQLIRNLHNVQIGCEPTALSVLTQGINGQRFANEDDYPCNVCGTLKAEKKCSACKMVTYCNQECQKLDWSTHKKFCKQLAEKFKEIQEFKRKEKEEAEKEKQREEELKQKQEEAQAEAKKKAEEEESDQKDEDNQSETEKKNDTNQSEESKKKENEKPETDKKDTDESQQDLNKEEKVAVES